MARYEITAPDGTKYEVTAPDTATEAEVLSYAESQFAGVEPVTTVDVPASTPADGPGPLRVDVNALPEAQRRPDSMAALRGFGDTMLLNFADEIGSAIEAGAISGPEYDAAMAENAALRAADDPNARAAGEVLGMVGGLLVPAGAASRVAGMGRQMAVGATTGAGMTALSGAGANGPGNRTATLGEDALIGAAAGAAAPVVAGTARKVAQIFGAKPETAAIDELVAAVPPEFRNIVQQKADEFIQKFGTTPRLIDILPASAARKLTNSLNRSDQASGQVIDALMAERAALSPDMARQIATNPTASNRTALVPAGTTGVGRSTGARDVRGEDAFKKATIERGDAEFGAFRDRPISTAGPSGVIIEDAIRNSTLTPLGKEEFFKAIEQGKLTGGQLYTLRKNLATRARQKPGEGFKEIADSLDEVLADQIPEARAAIDNYRKGMSAAEGAKFGASEANKTTYLATKEAKALLNPEQLVGVAPGARQALVERAIESPSRSYAFAKQLEESPGYQAQLRQLLPDAAEADAIIEFAIRQKKSIDNLAALARIPANKVESLVDDADKMINAIAAAGFGAGGAFKAALTRQFVDRSLGIGEKAANSLADMLLDPKKRDTAIKALERAGLPRAGYREAVQGAFISTANAVTTADRSQQQ